MSVSLLIFIWNRLKTEWPLVQNEALAVMIKTLKGRFCDGFLVKTCTDNQIWLQPKPKGKEENEDENLEIAFRCSKKVTWKGIVQKRVAQ